MDKNKILGGIINILGDFIIIDNIQITVELFKYFGIDLDKEIPDENGNKLLK